MLALIQSDAELGEILTRAFILRRVELVATGVGDVVLIGSTHSADTHRIKEFLMGNGHPYSYIDLERDPDVQNMLDSFHLTTSPTPKSETELDVNIFGYDTLVHRVNNK